MPVSAVTGSNLDTLQERIGVVIQGSLVPMRVVLPFGRGDLLELFHRRGHVAAETPGAEGVTLVGGVPRQLLGIFEPFAVRPGASVAGVPTTAADGVSAEDAATDGLSPAPRSPRRGTPRRRESTREPDASVAE
jgi:hypothetical protein